jgi:hypothetical protein
LTVKGENTMPNSLRKYLLLAVLLALTPFLAACGLANRGGAPAANPTTASGTPAQANPGEHEGTVPATAQTQAPPSDPASSPRAAVERFAVLYVNWTYATLAANQRTLAAQAVGEARAAERQAQAQTRRDTPLRRGHIYNRGRIVTVARANGGPGEWVVVTLEQTGGDQEYAGLQPSFHVTFADVQHVAGRWTVSAWRPEV